MADIAIFEVDWFWRERKSTVQRDDGYAELVEHLTAVTPEIDRRIEQSLERTAHESRAHPDAHRESVEVDGTLDDN